MKGDKNYDGAMIRRIEKIIKKKSQRSCSFIIYLINICFLYNKYVLGGLIFLENKNRQKPFNFLNYQLNHIITKKRKAN